MEFQSETKYNIFKKMTLEEINKYEKILENIYNLNYEKIKKMFSQYHNTESYQRKDELLKKYEFIPIETPMCPNGHYGFIYFNDLNNFFKKIHEENLKFNRIVNENNFDYLFINNEDKKMSNLLKKSPENNLKNIFKKLGYF